MKVLAVLLLVTAVWGWDEYKVFKKWSNMKAMESCWGEENMKTYTVQLKRAISKCHGTDAPELELPIYRSPFRFINSLMTSGQQHQEYLMEAVHRMAQYIAEGQNYNSAHQNNQFQNQRQPFQNNQAQNNPFLQQYRPNYQQGFQQRYPTTQNFQGQNFQDNVQSNNMPYDQVVNTVSVMKFIREFMKDKYADNKYDQEYYGPRLRNYVKDNANNYKVDSLDFLRPSQQFRFKRQVNGNTKPTGSDPSTLPGFLELGDRLAEKLKETKEKAVTKIGNFTCVMKEMNVLNDQNEIDVRGMKQELEKYNLPSQWFKNHEINNLEICYEMSESVPQSVQDDYNYDGAPNLAKMKTFLSCCKESKRRTCMYQDMKVKLENNFGPLEKILEQTGLTEAELFPLMQELLYSSEEMEYF